MSASNDGNYIIVKSGDSYSFEPSTAGLSSVSPGNLTNVTPNNKNYLLAIGSDNNFKQILFSNNTINNTFSYINDQWVLDKQGLYQQFADTQEDAVNMFSVPIIDKTKNTKIITPASVQTGKYIYNVKNVDSIPHIEKLSIDKEDINYTNSYGSNAHIIYVDRTGKLSALQLKDSWYNGIKYNESRKTYEFQKISFYDQAGIDRPVVNGFALPYINSSKQNDQITLPAAEQGQYIIDYTSSGPTLKKVSYISEVTPNTLFNSNPPDKDSFMIVSKDGFKALTPTENAAYIPSFDGTNITLKRLYSPRFTRYSLDTTRDFELPASGTTLIQDIFQDLTGINIENNSMVHLKIFFYLEDTSVQQDNIGSFSITRKTSATESEELTTHYIYSPVDNLITAIFVFPYSGNISSMQLVTSLSTGVKIIGGMKAEMLIDTQLRF
nr:hypothetical protein [uncultured Methanosphaera sp.]